MADMSWEDYVEQAKKASNAKKAEAEKKLNINNENIGKLNNATVKITADTQVGKVEVTGNATQEFLESLNSSNEVDTTKNFRYGSGNTTIGDFTRRFYGNNATEDQMRGIAAAIFGKDFKQQEGSDISKYTFDNSRATEYGTRVGAYLANNQQGLNVDNIDSTPYVGTNIRSEFNEVSGDILKRENIYSRLNDIGKMEGYSDLTSKEVNDISEILSKGNVGDLTDEQVKKFQEVRKNIAGMKSEIEQIAIDNGKNADDIFSKKDKSFANLYGDNQASFKTVSNKSHFLNYDVVDGQVVELDPNTKSIDYLKVAEGRKEYTTAKSKYNFNGTAIDYLEKNTDATFGNSDVTKLINLKKSGIDIGNEGERILQGYAYAGSHTKDANNPLVNNLNLAAQQQVAKYDNISDDNLAYLKEGGLQLTQEDGKFKISQQSIDLMTDDERNNKYKKLIDSNDVGKENLSELGGSLDRRYRENKVVDEINNQNMNNIINDDTAITNYMNNLNETQKADFDSYFNSNQKFKDEVNRRIGEELQTQQESSANNLSEYKTQLTDGEIANIENSVKEELRQDIEKSYIQDNYIKNSGINTDYLNKGASSNYDRITDSYAPSVYGDFALTKDEVLKENGITNEALRKEILDAKNFDDLSPEAIGALYNSKTELSQRDINLGNFKELSNQEIESIEKMNPELGKKLRNISAGDKAQILGRTQEEVSNYLGLDKDGLTSKLEMKRNASLDINDPKVARKVLEDLSNKNPEEALADLIDFTGNRKGYGDLKGGGQANKVLDAFRAGTLERDLRSGRLEQAYGIVRDTIDEIKSIHGKDFAKEYDQFDAKTNSMKDKFSVENMKKQAKNFEKADYDRIDAAFDKGLEATAKRMENLSGPLTRKSGNLGKAFDFFGSGKGKATLGLVGGMAAIFGVAYIAGNAAEERERKRQEMNQLIAAQNANIRSGY